MFVLQTEPYDLRRGPSMSAMVRLLAWVSSHTSSRSENPRRSPSIKREIGHLCHDERRSTPKEKTPAATSQQQSASVPNPPIDVARVHPGKHPLGSLLTRPVLLTLLLDVNSTAVRCTAAASAHPEPRLAEYEHDSTERLPIPTRNTRKRVLGAIVRVWAGFDVRHSYASPVKVIF